MSVVLQCLPDLPVGVKNGVAVLGGNNTLYAGLGSAGKRFFFLNLNELDKGWQRTSDFPAGGREGAVYIADKHSVWVFSGAGAPEGTGYAQVYTDVYRFDFCSRNWTSVETEIPVGLLGASGCEVLPGKFVFWGGYNKTVFDNFSRKASRIDPDKEPEQWNTVLSEFMSKEAADYLWNQNVLLYDAETNAWSVVGENPYPANCGAALIQQGKRVTLIDGEIKPGLRSTQIKQFLFDDQLGFSTSTLNSIEPKDRVHEGLAGAYAGKLQNTLFVMGGAYFIGSQKNRNSGQLYAHQGLKKHYSRTIWCLENGKWAEAAGLPEGAAYGGIVELKDKLVLVGGEDCRQNALAKCYLVEKV